MKRKKENQNERKRRPGFDARGIKWNMIDNKHSRKKYRSRAKGSTIAIS